MTESRFNRYHCLDARELNKIVDPSAVQTTITSPPYSDVKNYGRDSRQIGWNQNYDNYISDIRGIFQQCFEVTTSTGTLWVVVDTYKRAGRLKLLPLDLMRILENIGWIPQDIVIWDKVKNLPYSNVGQFRNNFEYILLCSKTLEFKYYIDRIREVDTLTKWWIKYPERYNPKGKVPTNLWRIPIPSQGTWSNGSIQHLCPFPPELVERLILLSTDEDDLVLDPFAGSGVVLAQAKCMGRRYVGFDIYERYIEKFYDRVLPEIERRYQNIENDPNRRLLMQQTLSRYIYSLRKLKYGKLLIDKLMHKYNRTNFKLVILDEKDVNNNSSPSFRVLIISADLVPREVLSWISGVVDSKPLSQFGLCPEFQVIRDGELESHLDKNDYAVYLEGKFYSKAYNVGREYVVRSLEGNFPPIISDIDISREMLEQSSFSSAFNA
jgi:DNA modification methylase